MFVEIHIIQNFAPSCLNRDESNAPKSCVFGGIRRARISSQCIKRSIREQYFKKYLSSEELGVRTKKIFDEIKNRLVNAGKAADEAEIVVKNLLKEMGIKLESRSTDTKVLLFFGAKALEDLAKLCEDNFDILKEGKDQKQIKNLGKEGWKILDGTKAVDIALFGRMIADKPDKNIDAATQVAHAISTNAMEMEFDFFTALDDSEHKITQGSGMMGAIQFNSACYYRYSNLDIDQLLVNIDNDVDLAIKGIDAFIKGSILAIPTGKQTTMAAINPPSFVMVILRESFLCSLTNAFLYPINPDNHKGLTTQSIEKLVEYYDWIKKTYGDSDIKEKAIITEPNISLGELESSKVANINELVAKIMEQIKIELNVQ